MFEKFGGTLVAGGGGLASAGRRIALAPGGSIVEGLRSLFFFLVGMEIKRELAAGEEVLLLFYLFDWSST